MLRVYRAAAVLAAAGAGATGCGPGNPSEKTIEIKTVSPLDQAKSVLKTYAGGQVPGSEAASYPKLVADVRQTDPAKADILEAGLNDIQKNPAAAKSKAAELLKKL